MKKNIEIKRKESQKNYLDDLKQNVQVEPLKEESIRKSILVNKSLDDKIKDYIFKKRTQGDIYYTQTKLITEALNSFLTNDNKL